MKKIRKGKSIECTLTVLTDGEAQALNKRALSLRLVRPNGVRVGLTIREAAENELRFTVLPSVQYGVGIYGFELWRRGERNGRWQTVVDVPGAFKLVDLTQEEGGEDAADLETGTLDMTARFTGGFAIIDNLESTRTDAGLSANMGRELGLRMEAAEVAAAGAMETAGTASSEAAGAKETAEAAMTAVEGKQDKLTAGRNIDITEENVVDCTLEVEAITVEEVDALF